MTHRERYKPGPASGATIEKDGDRWTLVLVRNLRHPPERVWKALTEPEHLKEWAPFDADNNMGTAGNTVKLTAVGAPTPQISETKVSRAEAPRFLEYSWGGNELRWELQSTGSGGTQLTLWHNIDRHFVSMGAAGWHICLDVLDHLFDEEPLGRIVAGEAMKFEWPRLNSEYAAQFGVETPKWPSPAEQKA